LTNETVSDENNFSSSDSEVKEDLSSLNESSSGDDNSDMDDLGHSQESGENEISITEFADK